MESGYLVRAGRKVGAPSAVLCPEVVTVCDKERTFPIRSPTEHCLSHLGPPGILANSIIMSKPPLFPEQTASGIAIDPRSLDRVIPESRRADGSYASHPISI